MTQKMQITGFGKLLFSSKDLDPVYCSLLAIKLPQDQLVRWMLAYWLFYHCGFASTASEFTGANFWKLLARAAENTSEAPGGGRWPRGTERRHFRGAAATGTIAELKRRYGSQPEGVLDFLVSGPMDVRSVIDRAVTHKLFGPWIGFKIADMIDGVVGIPVDQSDVSVFLYETPRKSILEKLPTLPINQKGDEPVLLERAMHWLKKELRGYYIPHKPKVEPDWFSLETVWCKHLSHMHGHYPMYKDIKEIRHGMEPWVEVSQTAKKFLACMPTVVATQPIQGQLF